MGTDKVHICDPGLPEYFDHYVFIRYGGAATATPGFAPIFEHHTSVHQKSQFDAGRGTDSSSVGVKTEDTTDWSQEFGVNFPSITNPMLTDYGWMFVHLSSLLRERDLAVDFDRQIDPVRRSMFAREIIRRAGLPEEYFDKNDFESFSSNTQTIPSLQSRTRSRSRSRHVLSPTAHLDEKNCHEPNTCGLLCASRVVQKADGSFFRSNIQAYWRKSVPDAFRRASACRGLGLEFDALQDTLLSEIEPSLQF